MLCHVLIQYNVIAGRNKTKRKRAIPCIFGLDRQATTADPTPEVIQGINTSLCNNKELKPLMMKC